MAEYISHNMSQGYCHAIIGFNDELLESIILLVGLTNIFFLK